MEQRPLGRTGITVSALGLGCAPLGSRLGPRPSRRVLQAAFDLGITVYDTADVYGQGDGERLIGEAFAGRRDRVVICTKVGQRFSELVRGVLVFKRLLGPLVRPFRRVRQAAGNFVSSQTTTNNYGPAEVTSAIEACLGRLRTEYIDVLLLHSPGPEVIERGEVFEALDRAVAAGRVRCYGVSCHHVEEARAALTAPAAHRVAVLQVPVNPYEPDVVATVLPRAVERGIGVMARAPFGGGRVLAPESVAAPAGPVGALHALARAERLTLAQAAIRFASAQPGVATVLPGMTTPAHLRENVAALRGTGGGG
jgi:aryl-alcohol dehydrogenase-like predicted oxidoreductase